VYPASALRRPAVSPLTFAALLASTLFLAVSLLAPTRCAASTDTALAMGPVKTTTEIIENTDELVVARFSTQGGGWMESVHLQVPDHGRIAVHVDPPGAARVSAPGLMRDLRIVQVVFEPTPGPIEVTVRLEATPDPGMNEKTRRHTRTSHSLRNVYHSSVLNYRPSERAAFASTPGIGIGDLGRRDEIEFGARYLIITSPTYASAVDDLAEWRHLMGLQTMVVDLNTTGYSGASIKSYIQTAYDTWAVPPEYVLLVGDTEDVPAYDDGTATDDYYAQLEGDDLFIDVLIGRLSADSLGDCATLVAKTLGYERTPVTSGTDWPTSGMLMVADDWDDGDFIYYVNTWFIYDLMENAEFTRIDTLFDRSGATSTQVYNAWNAGPGFVNFRGQAWTHWPGVFGVNPGSLSNGWKLPIVVSATCATGVYHGDGYISEEIVRAGSASYPRGGVAFIGSNTAYPGSARLARMRGAADMAFFEQAFGENGGELGAAALAAKFAAYDFDGDTVEYKAWNLLGDPAMRVWTGQPEPLQVFHDEYFHESQTAFDVTVLSAGQALEGALVACVKDGDIYAYGHTDASGLVSFTLAPSSSGPLSVTVTARNHIPYEGSALALDGGSFLVYDGMALDDTSGGNGDGLLSPGETAEVVVDIRNTGDQGASSVAAVLRSLATFATVVDSLSAFGNVLPDATASGSPPYTVSVSADCGVGQQVPLELAIANGDTMRSVSPPALSVASGDLEIQTVVIDDAAPGGDGGGDASAGEVVGLELAFENVGLCGVTDVTASLTSADPYVTVTSGSAWLGDLSPGAVTTNTSTPFVLSVAPDAPNAREILLRVQLAGVGHSYAYAETVDLELTVSGPTISLVSGPDAYGYYCYDQGDSIYAVAPDYEWFDIAPPGPGAIITEITDDDAATVMINLPFGCTYYGSFSLTVSVCSNGFVSIGPEDYRFGSNSAIPHTDGPENMIAPFWDDLDPSAGGDIYRYFDSENHRFIIQFDEVPIWNTTDRQTFQVILLDRNYYPTPTGDNQLLIAYQTVGAVDGCTIGIESPDETTGIQYLFDGTYDAHAAPLVDGSALLFTTEPPVEPDVPWIVLDGVTVDDTATGDGNGEAGLGEIVELHIELGNQGDANALGASATLVSGSPMVSVIAGQSTYPGILVGGTALNDTPFEIEIASAPNDTVATLYVDIESNGGGYHGTVRHELHIDLGGTGVTGLPLAFGLRPCYPNPFRGDTRMQLALPQATDATVRIYSPAGRLVRTLHTGGIEAGEHTVVWDGRDSTGRRVASGIYFVRAEAGTHEESRKVVLLK